MTDEQVLQRAIDSCRRASEMAPGTVQRAIQWAVFDGAMMELDRRLVRHVLSKLGRG